MRNKRTGCLKSCRAENSWSGGCRGWRRGAAGGAAERGRAGLRGPDLDAILSAVGI